MELSKEYFAAAQDLKQLAEGMTKVLTDFRNQIVSGGLVALWEKKLRNYYGNSLSGNSSQGLTMGGAQGELSLIKVNDLHSLIQDQLVTVTSQRPAGIARAINADTKSLKSAKIGKAVAEFYMIDKGFEKNFVIAAETALLLDESYVEVAWDTGAGEPVGKDPETGKVEMSGDPIIRNHSPWNVARDMGCNTSNNLWRIVTFKQNRFELAAKHPEFSDKILSGYDDPLPPISLNMIPEESDMIYCHLLIHDRCAAIPMGRYAMMVHGEIIFDLILPFSEYPLDRMTPADVIDQNLGYAPSTDLLAAEEVTDALHSVIVTNQVSFGGATIVGPKGANLNHQELAKGLRYLELEPDLVDKLKTLNLLQTSPEIFNYIALLGGKKEKAVGSVSGILAQQAVQGASGAAMALIQTQSISYNSGTQRSYFAMMSGVMTKVISALGAFAESPRIARIVGRSRNAALKQFKYSGEDLKGVSSIVYEIVNPASQTFGGRLIHAENLLKAGLLNNPKQYLTLSETGNLDSLTEWDEAAQMLILEENEALSNGEKVEALITENHAEHYKSHMSLITMDAKRSNPTLVTNTLEHCQQHLDLATKASQTNPGIMIFTGQQPIPQPGMIQQPGQPDQGGPMAPDGELNRDFADVSGGSPTQETASKVRQPNLPKPPGSNQEVQVPGVSY